MIRYFYFALLLSTATLLSGCGIIAGQTNSLAVKNNSIGTPEEVMKQQLTRPLIGGGCEVIKTIEIDGNSNLEACLYSITIDGKLSSCFVYFYKGKYVGHGDMTFPNKFVKEIENEKNPLLAATENGNINDVKSLLENNANPNTPSSDGSFPLNVATVMQNAELVELLLDRGANPNMTNKHGVSPLIFAAGKTNLEILNNLIKHGAKIDHKSELGITPLMTAVSSNNLEMVKELVAKGADINIIETQYGTTPILQAAVKKYYGIVEFLMRSGADRSIPDYKGITLRQQALNTNDNRLLDISRFNSDLVALEKIESDFSEEFKKYQERKEQYLAAKNEYEKKELNFLNKLNNSQLELYSSYADNVSSNNANIAKVLLSFRKFSGSLDKAKSDEFVMLYSEKQSAKSDAELLAMMDQNLIDRKKVIAELRKDITEADNKAAVEERQAMEEASNRQNAILAANQQALAAQQAQNTVGMLNILTAGLNSFNSIQAQKYNAQAAAYQQYSAQYESERRNRQLIDSIKGVENSIQRASRDLH